MADRPHVDHATAPAEAGDVPLGLAVRRDPVQVPLGETFYSPAFGMCIDRFGTPWMIMADMPGT